VQGPRLVPRTTSRREQTASASDEPPRRMRVVELDGDLLGKLLQRCSLRWKRPNEDRRANRRRKYLNEAPSLSLAPFE